MNEDPTAAQREWARERGLSYLEAPPWAELSPRLTLLLIDPPVARWAAPVNHAAFWLIAEGAEARSLPAAQRQPLMRDGNLHERLAGSDDEHATDWTVFTLDRIESLLEGLGRRSLEARWSVRHAAPLHDPLRRHERLAAAAARLPEDGLERVLRPLYAQASASVVLLSRLARTTPETALVAAGEAAGALCRLACVVERGDYPPAAWLLPAAKQTDLGGRISSWLDDLPRAVGGDEAAARRVGDGCERVAHATEAALRVQFGGTTWLQSPETAALRTPR